MSQELNDHLKHAVKSATVPLIWLSAGVELLRGFEDLPEPIQNIEAHVLVPAYLLLMYFGIWPAIMCGLNALDEFVQALGGDDPDTLGKFTRGDEF